MAASYSTRQRQLKTKETPQKPDKQFQTFPRKETLIWLSSMFPQQRFTSRNIISRINLVKATGKRKETENKATWTGGKLFESLIIRAAE